MDREEQREWEEKETNGRYVRWRDERFGDVPKTRRSFRTSVASFIRLISFSEMLLDPIRGNAAAFVATWHILPAFLPFLYFFLSMEMQGEGTKTCINTPQILYCSLCTLLSTCTLLSLIVSNTVDRITLTF